MISTKAKSLIYDLILSKAKLVLHKYGFLAIVQSFWCYLTGVKVPKKTLSVILHTAQFMFNTHHNTESLYRNIYRDMVWQAILSPSHWLSQENCVHQFCHLFLWHWRESHNENVDTSKPEYGWGILVSRIKNASFKFLQTPELRSFIAKLPALKEMSKSFFFVWCRNLI